MGTAERAATRESKPLILAKALEDLKEEITKLENLLNILEGAPVGKSLSKEDCIPCFKVVYDTLPDDLNNCASRVRVLREAFQEILL